MTDELRRFRRALREQLLARRSALAESQRAAAQAAVVAQLRRLVPLLPPGPLAFYWPIRGEIDLRPFAAELVAAGRVVALPVILAAKTPMIFRQWTPQTPMQRGVWDIPVPEPDERVSPRVVILPVVGVDQEGYRLGYGGGYYDRTLPTLTPPPLRIGVGYAFARIATIQPQPHDQRLDLLVNEAGIAWFLRDASSDECSLPSTLVPGTDNKLRPD